jgi:hypothetical protein
MMRTLVLVLAAVLAALAHSRSHSGVPIPVFGVQR